MPIDRKKYHPKWRLISYLIRFIRAKNRCEDCNVRNYAVRYWDSDAKRLWPPEHDDEPEEGFKTHRQAIDWATEYNRKIGSDYEWDTHKVSVVKLSVAHLDHDTQNNRFWNLRCKCQWCHLTHDRKDNAQKRMYGPTGRHHNQVRLEL
ncbi:hypothetical protein GO730_00635 [Spirosoma sp. HMF3257]|uniref:HNH endonuclease n=1 Tax=Spirosoma telluris TaxID=2183553 RepID=A0A327NH70_9BACT|nr:hypothetical protein [Spirosoma telluris]RAI73306.1 hypothetical protein HMF3257_00620 [Spirosoma telluris]